MSLSNEKRAGLICLLIFVVIVSIGLIRNKVAINNIAKNPHKVVCATITETYWRKGNWYCKFEYIFQGKKYYFPNNMTDDIGITKETQNNFLLGKKKIFIVFPLKGPKILFLLETEADYKKFNIQPTDTIGLICNN